MLAKLYAPKNQLESTWQLLHPLVEKVCDSSAYSLSGPPKCPASSYFTFQKMLEEAKTKVREQVFQFYGGAIPSRAQIYDLVGAL